MTLAIAAAGTGGHVFPALAVGQALVDLGVERDDVLFVGGDRLEAEVFPGNGFPFLSVEVRGLQRRITLANLAVPWLVGQAKRRIASRFRDAGVRAALGFGNYVTVPFGWAARSVGIPFFVHEQNAHAGLANRVAQRWAANTFVSFDETRGLNDQILTGNPVRAQFVGFSRERLRAEALTRYELDDQLLTVGIYGGSLGAGALNEAVATMLRQWTGPPVQVLHLIGARNIGGPDEALGADGVATRTVGFEDRMDLFFAASDLVVARAGGGVAEITATGMPSILVPGGFGSGGHQAANAAALASAGAAIVVQEAQLGALGSIVADLVADGQRRKTMANAALAYARPGAAMTIAKKLMEAAGD